MTDALRPRLILLLATCLGVVLLSGCANSGAAGPKTCGMILLLDGKHIHPSAGQFGAVEQKLGLEFTNRGLQLVPEITSADLIATIECRTVPDRPGMMDLIVRDIASNTFRGRSGSMSKTSDFPSIRAVELEQAQASSGLTRAGID